MGCNCGKKDLERLTKLDGSQEQLGSNNIFEKILLKLFNIGMGIVMSAIVLVCLVPLIIYILFGLIFGKQMNINLGKLVEKLTRKKVKQNVTE